MSSNGTPEDRHPMDGDGLDDLERRARSAGAALRGSVAGVAGAGGAVGQARWARPAVVLTGLVVVAAVAAGVVLAGDFGGDDDSATVVADGPAEVRPMAPAEVPAGMELISAVELWEDVPADHRDRSEVTTMILGSADGDPFETGDLVVVTKSLEADQVDSPSSRRLPAAWPQGLPSDLADLEQIYGDVESVELRDGSGYRLDLVSMNDPFEGEVLGWIENDATLVQIYSRQLGFEDLVAVAEEMDLSDPSAPELGWMPDGLEELAVTEGVLLAPERFSAVESDLYVLGYAGSASGDRSSPGDEIQQSGASSSLTIQTSSPDEASLLWARWVGGEEVQDLEVRTRPAMLVERLVPAGPGGGTAEQNVLVWPESDGTVVSVVGWELSVETLMEVAESLEPLDGQAWEAIRSEAPGPRRGTEVASGEASGEPWALTVEEQWRETTLCLRRGSRQAGCFGFPADERGPAGEPTGPLDHVRWGSADGLLYGMLSSEAATVALEVGGAEVAAARTVPDPERIGVAYFGLEAPGVNEPDSWDAPYDVVVYGADGQEIDRIGLG